MPTMVVLIVEVKIINNLLPCRQIMHSYTFDHFMNSSLNRGAYLFKRVVSMPRFELQTNSSRWKIPTAHEFKMQYARCPSHPYSSGTFFGAIITPIANYTRIKMRAYEGGATIVCTNRRSVSIHRSPNPLSTGNALNHT